MAQRHRHDLEKGTDEGKGRGIRQSQRKEEECQNDEKSEIRKLFISLDRKQTDEEQERKRIEEGRGEQAERLEEKHQEADQGEKIQAGKSLLPSPIHGREETGQEDASNGKAERGEKKERKEDDDVDNVMDLPSFLSQESIDDRQKKGEMETA